MSAIGRTSAPTRRAAGGHSAGPRFLGPGENPTRHRSITAPPTASLPLAPPRPQAPEASVTGRKRTCRRGLLLLCACHRQPERRVPGAPVARPFATMRGGKTRGCFTLDSAFTRWVVCVAGRVGTGYSPDPSRSRGGACAEIVDRRFGHERPSATRFCGRDDRASTGADPAL